MILWIGFRKVLGLVGVIRRGPGDLECPSDEFRNILKLDGSSGLV